MSEATSTVPVHEQPIGTTGLDNRKLGMLAVPRHRGHALSALIAGFLDMRSRSPAGANHVLNIPLTAFNTWVLICSSLMVALSVAASSRARPKRCVTSCS